MQFLNFNKPNFFRILVNSILLLFFPISLLVFASRASAEKTRVGPGSFELRCFSNQDGKTAVVNWTIDGEGVARIGKYRLVFYNIQGSPPNRLDTRNLNANGATQERNQVEVGFPGPGMYEISVGIDSVDSYIEFIQMEEYITGTNGG
jgi:hypothetical protein